MKPKKSGLVSQEEVDSIGQLTAGRAHWLRKMLREVEVGAIVKVHRLDWEWRTKSPSAIVNSLHRTSALRFKLTEAGDDTGWFIQRVE
jgi:hypothetical protein